MITSAILFTLLLAQAPSTASKPVSTPAAQSFPEAKGPDDGSINGQTYTNRYFQLSYTLPKDWVWYPEEAMARINGKLASDLDKKLGEGNGQQSAKAAHFLAVSTSSPPGAAVMVAAEDLMMIPGIRTPDQYLDLAMKNSGMTEVGERSSETLGGVPFRRATATQQSGSITITHLYYAALTRRFAVVVDAMGQTEEQRKSAVNTLSTFELHSPLEKPKE